MLGDHEGLDLGVQLEDLLRSALVADGAALVLSEVAGRVGFLVTGLPRTGRGPQIADGRSAPRRQVRGGHIEQCLEESQLRSVVELSEHT